MYAYAVPKNDANTDFSFETVEDEKEDLYYWRKLNALHGWMERLYDKKGGTARSFNCVPVRLTEEDILQLQKDAPSLHPVQGFFFGSDEYSDEDKKEVLDFIEKALAVLKTGKEVYYDSWW
jgi:hypothetical protein